MDHDQHAAQCHGKAPFRTYAAAMRVDQRRRRWGATSRRRYPYACSYCGAYHLSGFRSRRPRLRPSRADPDEDTHGRPPPPPNRLPRKASIFARSLHSGQRPSRQAQFLARVAGGGSKGDE